MLTQERLQELVRYDPETGEFTRINAYHKSKIGKVSQSTNNKGHMQMAVGGRTHLLHRLAWLYVYGKWPVNQIDHIDGDKKNNRISNLREATNYQNSQNRTRANKNSKSGYLGVYPRNGRWAASIKVNGRSKVVGWFDDPLEAHKAYLTEKAVIHPFGEVAKGYRK